MLVQSKNNNCWGICSQQKAPTALLDSTVAVAVACIINFFQLDLLIVIRQWSPGHSAVSTVQQQLLPSQTAKQAKEGELENEVIRPSFRNHSQFYSLQGSAVTRIFQPSPWTLPSCNGGFAREKRRKKKSGVFNWVNKLSIPYYLHERRLNWVERPLK